MRLIHYNCIRFYSKQIGKYKPPWNILFFGTDRFSLASLRALNNVYKNNDIISKLEVVTSTKSKINPIYKFSDEERLNIHRWPTTTIVDFHIGLVVSFGYLIPQNVINAFPLGMLNVHASLLPRWRGAAPIIHAIANGDSKTGITIMQIKPKHFDIGEIVAQETVGIDRDVKLPILYETLADLGAKLLVKQLDDLPNNLLSAKPQPEFGITNAPKVTNSFGIIDWSNMTAEEIYNRNRALAGLYPLSTNWNGVPVKLTDVKLCQMKPRTRFLDVPGSVIYDKVEKLLIVQCSDGKYISIENVGVQNKRTISAGDFNNGYLKKLEINKRIFK